MSHPFHLRPVHPLQDLIKSGGEWISSVDMENHISALPAVQVLLRTYSHIHAFDRVNTQISVLMWAFASVRMRMH